MHTLEMHLYTITMYRKGLAYMLATSAVERLHIGRCFIWIAPSVLFEHCKGSKYKETTKEKAKKNNNVVQLM